MNITCTAVENYRLTLGKIYEVHDESRDFYTIINDNNVGVRYAKRLFATEEEIEAAAPTPPARTEADVIASITYNATISRVQFTDINNELQTVTKRFSVSGSNISCGVNQTSGINNQISEIDAFFDLDEDDFLAVRKALFTRCVEEYVLNIRNAGNQAMAILSTNVSGEDNDHEADEDMLEVLDTLAHKTSDTMRNPNSDRDIRVWILQYRR